MPGINLSHSAEQTAESRRQASFGRGSVSIIVFSLLVLVLWGGASQYEKKLSTEVAAIATDIEKKRGVFSGADVDDIADIQFRVDIIKSELAATGSPTESLRSIEELLLPGVRLVSYAFDPEEYAVTLSGEADSIGTIAKQLVLMKRVPGFSSLSVERVALEEGENGKTASFDLSITLARPQ